jgi:hypothetical protein
MHAMIPESKVRSNLVFRPLPELLRASSTTLSLRLHCSQKVFPNGVESAPWDNYVPETVSQPFSQ